ncbi:ABC transporter permease [Calothrix sp. PCC 7507]|uniref:ABC transporter permease n=1 Tax=Calothrix sp. PCC 7507 TaxID=99598 RepID=UPI00029ECE27|nr:ABC transporter permease [Calothrix sp. PCC 7507]AFY33169.1 ABC-2 type transporter [Calothrix sp. PCC 7507]
MTLPRPTAAQLVSTHQEGDFIRTLGEITLIARRNLLLDWRNPSVIVGATGFPVFLLLIFTASFAKVVMPNGTYADYAQFLVPLTIVQGLLFSTIDTGTALYNDLNSGMDTRLRTLPIARSAVLAGRIFSSAGRLLIQVVIITLVGYLLGFRFQTSYLAIVPFLILPVIFTSSFAWLAVFFAVKFKTPESVQAAMIPWLLPLTFLSIGYVPQESFPDWLQGFVELNPVSVVAQALRGLSTGGSVAGSAIATLLWSFALTLVFSTLATRAYSK